MCDTFKYAMYSILFHNLGRFSGAPQMSSQPSLPILFCFQLLYLSIVKTLSIPVHSVILCSRLFFCLLLFLFPFSVPCRIVFATSEDLITWPNHLNFRFLMRVRSSLYSPMADKPEDLETWPNHLRFHFLTMVRSSSYSPMAAWIFL